MKFKKDILDCESDGEVKVKKKIYKRWWFWAIVVVLALGVIGSSVDSNSETPIASETSSKTDEPVEPSYIKKGMYKVGDDLAAGEYMILGSGYGQVSSDSTGNFDSIVQNENYNNSWYVTVNDGEYLEFSSGKAYPIADAPVVDSSGKSLPQGMYKIGKDLPAGEYKITSSSGGYVEVSNGSRGAIDDIVSNDNFSGDKYITVSDGQYLTLTKAELILK